LPTPCFRASAHYGSQNEQLYCPVKLVHDHPTYLKIHKMDLGEKEEYCMKSVSKEKERKERREKKLWKERIIEH